MSQAPDERTRDAARELHAAETAGRPPLRLDDVRQVGPYRILGSVGQGGMGSVLLAQHPTLPRKVALKVVGRLNDPLAVERFRREGELLARVRHPNVVGVHEFGHDPQLGDYLVTELVEGRDLGKEDPFEPGLAAEILLGVAEGAQALHEAGVLHRDLKPANVLLRSDGTPVLIDFGLAWSVDAETLTKTGTLVGTPAFMAPEQVRGRSKELDARTDVYGLGALGFCLLTARAPFDARSIHELLASIVAAPPAWQADPVPASLRAVIDRCLAKDPADRYGSAAEVAAELRRFLAGMTPLAQQASVRRPRTAVVLGFAAAAAVALAGLAFALTRAASAPDPTPPPRVGKRTPAPTGPAGWEAFERLLATRRGSPADDVALLERWQAWLSDHPEHPARPRALEARDALRESLSPPLRLGELRCVPTDWPVFVGNDRLVVPRGDRATLFRLGGRPEREDAFPLHAPRDRRSNSTLRPTWWALGERIYGFGQRTSEQRLDGSSRWLSLSGFLLGSCEAGLLLGYRGRVRLAQPDGQPADHPLARRPPLDGSPLSSPYVHGVHVDPRTNTVLVAFGQPNGPWLEFHCWTDGATVPGTLRRPTRNMLRGLDLNPSAPEFLIVSRAGLERVRVKDSTCESAGIVTGSALRAGPHNWIAAGYDRRGERLVGLLSNGAMDRRYRLAIHDLATKSTQSLDTEGGNQLQLSPDRTLAVTFRIDAKDDHEPTLWLLELP